MHFYTENKELFSDEVDVNNSIIMCGSYDSNLDGIQKTMVTEDFSFFDVDPSEYPTVENMKIFDKAVKILIRKLKPIILSDMDEEDLKYTYFNEDTYAGFRYVYTIGARNKREKKIKDNDVIKSRAIHMPEYHNDMS
jgi:hypothetical protein